MLEILKHSLGLCGEHWHPNIFTFLMGGFGSLSVFSYIKHKIKLIYFIYLINFFLDFIRRQGLWPVNPDLYGMSWNDF
jgi:hypothetical protein